VRAAPVDRHVGPDDAIELADHELGDLLARLDLTPLGLRRRGPDARLIGPFAELGDRARADVELGHDVGGLVDLVRRDPDPPIAVDVGLDVPGGQRPLDRVDLVGGEPLPGIQVIDGGGRRRGEIAAHDHRGRRDGHGHRQGPSRGRRTIPEPSPGPGGVRPQPGRRHGRRRGDLSPHRLSS
jgi:hypothetical protein